MDRLLAQNEDSNPDRYAHVPISGLKTRVEENEPDLATTMTKADLAALPEVKLTTPSRDQQRTWFKTQS